jgi:hypothetical protein
MPPYPINANQIAQYVRHHSCSRRLRLSYNNSEVARDQLPYFNRVFNPLDPALQQKGSEREDEWAEDLRDEGVSELVSDGVETAARAAASGGTGAGAATDDSDDEDEGDDDREMGWIEFMDQVSDLGRDEQAFAREVKLNGLIGVFDVSARVDFLVIRRSEDGPKLRVVETKSSREDKTYQRIQLATYRELIRQRLSDDPLTVERGVITEDDMECVVARIDDSTNRIEDILELDPLNLESETDDLHQLLEDGGEFEDIITTDPDDIDDLDYKLGPKCDQCVFDVHCLPESARQRKLELLSLSPPAVQAFHDRGVESIDDLAELDLGSPRAGELRRDDAISENLAALQARAEARRQNLPGGDHDDEWEVEGLPFQPQTQRPPHTIDDDQVIRVYLNITYDYIEDRVDALAAHVTRSDPELNTPFRQDEDGDWEPSPEIVEEHPDNGNRRDPGRDPLVRIKPGQWRGEHDADTEAEAQLIQGFLQDLVERIASLAEQDEEYIHFYVWSHSEMEHLIEACSRCGTELLGHLRELLGCREPLEQMIFTSLQSDTENRYALGWTGQGLAVATSLSWFGSSYHWVRNVMGEEVDLSRAHEQDIFDFKTTLGLDDENEWTDRDSADRVERFEMRSRFHDDLPMGYMQNVWGELPDPDDYGGDPQLRGVLDRYQRSDRPKLKAYLRARTHALRWLDEQMGDFNDDIEKARLSIPQLVDYELDVEDAAQAGIDFLLLDHHVGTNDWLASNIKPLAHRVPQGEALPLADAHWIGDMTIEANLDFTDFEIGTEEFRRRGSFEEDDFIRICPRFDNPERGPTYGWLKQMGYTCVIEDLDWENQRVELDAIPCGDGNTYRLPSRAWYGDAGDPVYDDRDPVMVSSISDYVDRRVDERLRANLGEHAYRWLDPEAPTLPEVDSLDEDTCDDYRRFLETLEIEDGETLIPSQRDAVLDGLETRMQLVHGPPGTGKTTTTAVAVMQRIVDHLEEGDIILLAGNTHRAVNNLLLQIEDYRDTFTEQAERFGFDVPNVNLAKVSSSHDQSDAPGSGIPLLDARSGGAHIQPHRDDGVLIIGGTVSSLLKQVENLNDGGVLGNGPDGFLAPELIVDEASMMVFPHFLSLASLVEEDGRIMLAGDHRQLAPIVDHEWEDEDRPPVQHYKPHSSAFEAARALSDNADVTDAAIQLSALRYTFRLPPAIRALVGQLYQSHDELELEGATADDLEVPDPDGDLLEAVWEEETGLFLLVHDEDQSRLSNPYEAELISQLIETVDDPGEDSIAVMTPHTAQRSNLQLELEEHTDGSVMVVDTVERLQGGECENIIVSGTASDPTDIGEREDFLLDLNRSNVAFSRPEERLIVVCSKTLVNHIPPDVEDYNSAMLWKSLRRICNVELDSDEIAGETVELYAVDPTVDPIRDVIEE